MDILCVLVGRPYLYCAHTESSFNNNPNKPPDPKVVHDVCLVIDVLGGDFKYVVEYPLSRSRIDLHV